MFRKHAVALLSAGIVCLSSGAAEMTLKNADMEVKISADTGQVLTLTDASDGTCYVTSTADQYFWGHIVAGGAKSDESRDTVSSAKPSADGARFECRNSDFPWLTLTKEYLLKGNILSKTVTYCADAEPDNLFSIRSKVQVAPDLWKGGAFFFPKADGYLVQGSAQLETKLVTRQTPLNVNNAGIIASFPSKNRVLAHYLYQINGRIANTYTGPVPAILEPGGWQTGTGAEFLSKSKSYSLTTHLTLVKGAPRHFHLQYYSLPEFVAFRADDTAAWVKKAGQWSGAQVFRAFLDPTMDLYTWEQCERNLRSVYSDEDEYFLMDIFSPRGDYELRDPMRVVGADNAYSQLVPLAQMKAVMERHKALSPRHKFGLYTMIQSVTDTPESFFQTRKDWLIYKKDGSVEPGPGGFATPDYNIDMSAPGWADNYLRQADAICKNFGVDFWYMDDAPMFVINWKEKRIFSTADSIALFKRLRSEVLKKYDVPLMLNCGWGSALICDFGLFENYNYPEMEKQDWETEAYGSFLSKLCRLRPYGHSCAMVQSYAPWNIHFSGYGLNGRMGAGASNGPAYFITCVVFQRLSTELFDAVSVPLAVHPCWFSGDQTDLEVGALRKGDAYILPIVWHGAEESEQMVSLDAKELGFDGKSTIFALDSEVTIPPHRDLNKVVPFDEEAVALRTCRELPPTGKIEVRLKVRNQVMHHLSLTQVPGVVLTSEGRPCYTMQPENRGVRIQGRAAVGAKDYAVQVSSSVASAEILLWIPSGWQGAAATIQGKPVETQVVEAGGAKFLKAQIGEGNMDIAVAEAKTTPSPVALANPEVNSFEMLCSSFMYANMSYRTFRCDEDPNEAVLEVSLIDKTKPGRFVIYLFPDVLETGLEFSARAPASGAKIGLSVIGPKWGQLQSFQSEAICDWSATLDKPEWQKFSLEQKEFGRPVLAGTSLIKFVLFPSDGVSSVRIKGLQLHVRKEAAALRLERRYAVIPKVSTPPNPHVSTWEAFWNSIEPEGNFFDLNGGPAQSQTKFWACYDDNALYFYIRNWQPISKGEPEKEANSSTIWNSNCNEILINPVPEKHDYFHFMIDSGGNRYGSVNSEKLGEQPQWKGEWEAGVAINYQVSWDVKLKFPFSALGVTPKKGDVWRMNVTRSEQGAKLFLSSWSASPGGWCQPENFGTIVFGDEVGKKFDLSEIALFNASFDGTLTAQTRIGRMTGTAVGAIEFVPGLVGQALVISNAQGCTFPAADHIQARQGTIEFYAKVLDWHKDDGLRHQLFSAGDSTGAVSIFTTMSSVFGYFIAYPEPSKPVQSETLLALPKNWVPNSWHHVVLAWNEKEQVLTLDGESTAPLATGKALPKAFNSPINVGNQPSLKDPGSTAIDELHIYPRMLTPEEVRQRYETFKALLNK